MNSTEFEAGGRVLRLKQYLGITARPPVINAVLDALMKNTRVEALYIQNFEDVRPIESADLKAAGCATRKLPCSLGGCLPGWMMGESCCGAFAGLF